jgi:lipid-binding SYLF domain-containing protein
MRFKLLTLSALSLAPMVFGADDVDKRIHESANVLREILDAGDRSIPRDLIEKSHCVGVIPNLKRAGFIVGAKYGKGVVTCRIHETGKWSAPSTIRIEGGSVGFQIGAGETDVVFVVNNQRGEDAVMKDKFTIGADASAMAGPVGRSTEAETDAMMKAEMLAWSRSRGVFAGVALEGATMRPDNDDNHKTYGRDVTQHEILTGKVPPPPAAAALYQILDRYPFRRGTGD